MLLAFWPEADRVRLLLTERSHTLSSHAGQIAFPGGRVDPGDRSASAAAVREAQEEVGLSPEAITLITELDESWSGAGHRVRAFVGWLDEAPRLRPRTAEVASVHVVDVEPLFEQTAPRRTWTQLRGQRYEQFHFDFAWGHLWGLSAELLVELFESLRGQRGHWAERRLERLSRYLDTHPEHRTD